MKEEIHLSDTAANYNHGPVTLFRILLTFFKIGAFTFGGGYAILPMIQQEIVDRQNWVDASTFMDALVITQSLPGPFALNCAIIIGRRLRGTAGGLIAALGIVLPSFLIILFLVAFFLPLLRHNPYVQAIFYGVRATVVALVGAAAWKLGRTHMRNWQSRAILVMLLIPAFWFGLHPIAVLAIGALLGLVLFHWPDRDDPKNTQPDRGES